MEAPQWETDRSEEADLDAYVCGKWPDACNKEPRDYGHRHVSPAGENLLHRVTRWAAGLVDQMPRGGYPLVPREEAEQRARICAACPPEPELADGVSWLLGIDSPLLAQTRRLQKPPANLAGCQVLGYDNNTAVFLPFERLPISEETRQRLPSSCWRK